MNLHSRLLILFLILTVFLGGACGGRIEGHFGWSSTDDRGLEEPRKSLLTERVYRLGRKQLYFYNYETIWWVYNFREGSPKPGELVAAALYENNNTPTPVEVDLRQIPAEEDGSLVFIRQQYDPLPPGRYLLKIAIESKVVDQVGFEIVPPGGPAAMGGNEEPESNSGEEQDEILRYSS